MLRVSVLLYAGGLAAAGYAGGTPSPDAHANNQPMGTLKRVGHTEHNCS